MNVLKTRDIDEERRPADRVAIMRGGEIVATGTVEEIRPSACRTRSCLPG